jgi:hypothetical protein
MRMMEFADLPRKQPRDEAAPALNEVVEDAEIRARAPAARQDLTTHQAPRVTLPPTESEEPKESAALIATAPERKPRSSIRISDIAPPEVAPVSHLAAEKDPGLVQAAQFNETSPSRSSPAGDGFVPRRRKAAPAKPTAGAGEPARIASRTEVGPRRGAAGQTSPRGATSGAEFQSQLEELDVELSLMVSRPQTMWDLAGLQARTAELADSGGTPVERGQARLLLDKIRAFEDKFAATGPTSGLSAPPIRSAAKANDPHYDGEGWLKEMLATRGPAAAPYALVDDDGRRICLVAPLPGRTLTSYVNKKVGVYGKRGWHAELKTPHLTAERVIDLDTVRR